MYLEKDTVSMRQAVLSIILILEHSDILAQNPASHCVMTSPWTAYKPNVLFQGGNYPKKLQLEQIKNVDHYLL